MNTITQPSLHPVPTRNLCKRVCPTQKHSDQIAMANGATISVRILAFLQSSG
jgi:hypothetical protein